MKKFGMKCATYKRTPGTTHLMLTKNEKGIDVDQSPYRSMIGSLLYLTASRPDIAFAVGVCTRYQAAPKMSHLTQVKRILKYISGTCDYGSADDRKSTSGGCFFLGNKLISWFSKKQNSVSLSTAEAEYIAARSGCSQLLWMKIMLKEYNDEQLVMTLYCDNLNIMMKQSLCIVSVVWLYLLKKKLWIWRILTLYITNWKEAWINIHEVL
ncbi:secreted RxLR effector protein 161-like [Trifolium pratense]|uniref:secreted RxLR effector protein 161-like n=1 Tax=Trifolium pratense TaxID=57577 RepID=UPI001E6905C8|nr:secreted RxLR effector protein 161-like [Trifolium pratense]